MSDVHSEVIYRALILFFILNTAKDGAPALDATMVYDLPGRTGIS